MVDINLKGKIIRFLEENNVSVYDLAYEMNLDVFEYQEFLCSKMRARSTEIFDQIDSHFRNKHWENLQSSITEMNICSLNDGDNNGRYAIKFICKLKHYILAYDLWDMLNSPADCKDEIMLILDDNGSVDNGMINLLSDLMEVNHTDVNQDNLLARTSTDESLKLMELILDRINEYIDSKID